MATGGGGRCTRFAAVIVDFSLLTTVRATAVVSARAGSVDRWWIIVDGGGWRWCSLHGAQGCVSHECNGRVDLSGGVGDVLLIMEKDGSSIKEIRWRRLTHENRDLLIKFGVEAAQGVEDECRVSLRTMPMSHSVSASFFRRPQYSVMVGSPWYKL